MKKTGMHVLALILVFLLVLIRMSLFMYYFGTALRGKNRCILYYGKKIAFSIIKIGLPRWR